MNKLSDIIGDMLFPDDIKCILCGRDIPVRNRLCLCRDCTLEENVEFCIGCGRALMRGGVYCDDCQHERHPFDVARAPLVYDGSVKTLIRRLKYGNARYLAPYLAALMAETWMRSGHTAAAVTFVPMHPSRKRKRGYNQAELLARCFCEITGLPLADMLERVKNTPNLARMDRATRAKSISDAIICKSGTVYDSVIVVDDVFTTGATASACAQALKSAKVRQVIILTAATAREERPLETLPSGTWKSSGRAKRAK